ncbi:MAG: glycosyltransferase [Gammaproteobacteria bacterium]|nr:MAG: glycosyltransferase [Gammaproteobacteria bacterium]
MKISLVVPVFNEEEMIPIFYQAVRNYAQLKAYQVNIIFIDDGSSDNTAHVLQALAKQDEQVDFLSFTRNFGKESALFAGLEHADGDVIIPIDVDLQDPIEVIPDLLAQWQAGADIVLAQRTERESDSFMKRRTAKWFYKVHNLVSEPKIEENVGDFRLMSKEVVDSITQLSERNLFMKGILSWVGYKQAIVTYRRPPRQAGKSKFNMWKLWNLALQGITSFSTAPLKISTYLGLFIAVFSFIYGGWLIVDKLLNGNPVPGYPSLMASILFLGGVQLIAIGILGEYVGRIYIETKRRPRYLLKKNKKQP